MEICFSCIKIDLHFGGTYSPLHVDKGDHIMMFAKRLFASVVLVSSGILVAAYGSSEAAQPSDNPVHTPHSACVWGSNNDPSFCLTMEDDQSNFPGDLLVLVSKGTKGQGATKADDFVIEVRAQESGGDDDLISLYTVTGGGDFKAVHISELPCGGVLLRGVIGSTPSMPEGTERTGALAYNHVCS